MAITINVNLDEILAALKNDLDFTGNADKYIKVNATADGFEFSAVSTSVSWGEILGLLSDQTDLQSALDLKANLAGASFTGAVSVTTSGSGDTLQLTNSGSGTTLNILNSGSGDFFAIDTNKLVVSNNGNLSVDTNTLFVDATNNRVGAGITSSLLARVHINTVSGMDGLFVNQINEATRTAATFQLLSDDANKFLSKWVSSSGTNSLQCNGVFSLVGPSTQISLQRIGTGADTYFLATGNTGFFIRENGNNAATMFQQNGTGLWSVGGGIGTPQARWHIYTASTSVVGQIIQAAAGQTANLLEVKNSAGTNLFHITASGGIATNGNAGFTGTGSYTNFTIENGIITAAS